MNDLQVFKNAEFGEIRTVTIDNEPWFVGKDVAAILGYANQNEAIQEHIDKEDKLNSKTLSSFELDLGQRGGWIINESGLYSLILSSKMPNAKKFKRWVTSEVLPSIRKHGTYMTNDIIERTLKDPDYLIQLATALKEERMKRNELEAENEVQKQQIAEMKPKVSYYDIVLQSPSLVKIGVIASDYGMSANKMNTLLHDIGVQYKQSDIWLLYSKYRDKGYTQTKTHVYDDNKTKSWMYWTQKGRLFIYDLLKANGVLPLIEQEVQE